MLAPAMQGCAMSQKVHSFGDAHSEYKVCIAEFALAVAARRCLHDLPRRVDLPILLPALEFQHVRDGER